MRGLLEDALVMTRLLNNNCSRSVTWYIVGRGETDHDLLDLTIAQRTDIYVSQSYSV